MKLFWKVIVLGMLSCILLYGLYLYQPALPVAYPVNCSFIIDPLFSVEIHNALQDFIQVSYRLDNNPQELIPKIQNRFDMIQSILINLDNPENIIFSITACQPVCKINNDYVTSVNGKLSPASIFTSSAVDSLQNIMVDAPLEQDLVLQVVKFYQALPSLLLHKIDLHWADAYHIYLNFKLNHQAENHNLSLLTWQQNIPSMHDVECCIELFEKELHGLRSIKKNQEKVKTGISLICDLRFDRQVIVFSTNKGV